MTNEEAIKIIQTAIDIRKTVHKKDVGPMKARSDRIVEALENAIRALQKEET